MSSTLWVCGSFAAHRVFIFVVMRKNQKQNPTIGRCKRVSDARLSKTFRTINNAQGRKLRLIRDAAYLRCLEQSSPQFQFSQIPLTNILRFIASANKTEMQQILLVTNERRAEL